jgi:acyl-CoA thioesterase-1
MSSVALHFASGAAFFTGTALLFAGLIIVTYARRKILLPAIGRIFLLGGLFCVIMSATPLPVWARCVWGTTLVTWAACAASIKTSNNWRTAALAAAAGCTLASAVGELSFHLPPRAVTGRWERLVVIGDSLSAADFTEGGEPWPTLLARDSGVTVVNLAFSGANAASAEKRVSADDVAGALVLMEIGGNDILGATSSSDFEMSLDRLLQKVCRKDNAVVMLELPLPPLYNRFGEIQRRLARRYNVILIPKRYFAGVLIGPQSTIDSLHLSPAGHRKMAALIARFVLPGLAGTTRGQGAGETRRLKLAALQPSILRVSPSLVGGAIGSPLIRAIPLGAAPQAARRTSPGRGSRVAAFCS